MKKKLLFTFAISILTLSFNANAKFDNNQIQKMEKSISVNLEDSLEDPVIQACWSSYRNGSEKSLSALYLMGESQKTIKNLSVKRNKLLSSVKSKKELAEKIGESANKKDFEALKKALGTWPKTKEYCQKIYNEAK